MRGTVAKRIRREVYGDFATSEKGYKLNVFNNLMDLFVKGKRDKRPITVVTTGLRPKYQQAKRLYRMAA
jgi:hypothetical protein